MPASAAINQLRFCAIDFESAGARPGKTDVPVQLGLARWSLSIGHHDPFVSYLAADSPVTWAARKVHGIHDSDLIEAPRLQELWPTLRSHLHDHVVVAHGMGTEKRFLRAFPGHRFGPWIDTLQLSRAAYPGFPDHSLSALCDQLGLSPAVTQAFPDRRWHDALFDAAASLYLLERIIHAFGLDAHPLDALLRPDLSAWARNRRR